MKAARRRIEVNLEDLDRVLNGAREAPLSESDHGKLKDTLHALAEMLMRGRNTEKTSGTPFYRLEQLEDQLGIPLPAATQWEIVEEAAQVIRPARDELIRQAAQGTVVHNDDTGMRVLMLKRDPSDERTGMFTSGIGAVDQGWKIALYFTGSRHAGENIAEVLKKRHAELPSPIQMCDALSRDVPKLPAGVEVLLANCLAHGRRQFARLWRGLSPIPIPQSYDESDMAGKDRLRPGAGSLVKCP
jgi:hypothetical protein